MVIENLTVGSLVVPRISVQLFSSLFKGSADGSVFSPELGFYVWDSREVAIVVEVFEMPFDRKKLYKVLLSRGAAGWVWDNNLLAVYKENKT